MTKKIYQYFFNDSLYKNSLYLIASTLVMAVLGFFFWLVNARLFTTAQIGLATTLISVMALITSLSLLGLDAGIIRYLPKSKRKSDEINTCFTIVTLVTVSTSIIFLLGLKTFSPKLLFIRESLFYALLFIIFMFFSIANSLFESVFIAFRDAKFILVKNTIFSLLKIILPFFLVTLGAYGIFSSWMIALAVGLGISLAILISRFGYQPRLVLYKSIVEKIGRFSFGSYLAGFFVNLPVIVLPLMITNLINSETTAYFYMAMMIADLLFMIPYATTQSLFAEGSYGKERLREHIKKAIKIISLILIPAIFITVFFGKYILLAFGKDYSIEGFRFLQLLALSGVFISINSIFRTILKVEGKIKEMIFINFLEALLILGLSYLLISKGLLGIGLAWISGQSMISLFYFIIWFLLYFNRSISFPSS